MPARGAAVAPDLAGAHNALGTILETQGKHDEALACFQHAVRIAPAFVAGYNNLGGALKSLGKYREAIVCFEEALRLDDRSAEAYNGLGAALQCGEQPDEARAAYECALSLNPNYAEANSNLGRLLGDQGHFDAALQRFNQTARMRPEWASAHHNRGLMLLLTGDLAGGWPEYEWRWQMPGVRPRPAGPAWQGEPLAGRTILLFHEQGLGDTLQFIRYVPLVKARGGRVIVQCARKLIPILGTCAGIDELVADDQPPPDYDLQAALLSLPGIFQTRLDTIPAAAPYLSAPEELVQRWRSELGDDGRLRVGINWQGNPTYRHDAQRSVRLEAFAPLAAIEGVRLLSLQKGFGSEQMENSPFPVEDLGSRLDADGRAFYETAAVIKNLDLVVTSDTAVAHLAGALGAPVWVALPLSPDWRWFLDREDSPWYPTMRLFRQGSLGDWPDVFRRIAGSLSPLAARVGSQSCDSIDA